MPAIEIMVGVIVIIVLVPDGIRALRQASQAQGTFAGNCSLVLMCVFPAPWEVMTSVPAVDRHGMGKALELCQACVGLTVLSGGLSPALSLDRPICIAAPGDCLCVELRPLPA